MSKKMAADPACAVEEEFIPCHLLRLPEVELMPAAQDAIEINPVNRPNTEELARADPQIELTAQRIAALTSKYWGSSGVKLTTAFLDSPDAETRRKILHYLNWWSREGPCSVVFVEASAGSALVRISRERSGYWSYLGTDIRRIPRGSATMNLQGFTASSRESEYQRVVVHEAGHTLGFPHEHMRQALVGRLDPQKTIEYFRRTQGWSPQEVRQQVLTPLEEVALLAPTPADQDSIMTYSLPAEITINGQPIRGGSKATALDLAYAARIYPAPGGPVEPPPAEGPVITVAGSIGPGRYRLVKEG